MAFWLRMGNRGTFLHRVLQGRKGSWGGEECEPGLCQAADFTVALAHFLQSPLAGLASQLGDLSRTVENGGTSCLCPLLGL